MSEKTTERIVRRTTDATTETQRITTLSPSRKSTTEKDRRDNVRAIQVTKTKPNQFFGNPEVTKIDADIETQATLTLNYSLKLTTSTTRTTATTTTMMTTSMMYKKWFS